MIGERENIYQDTNYGTLVMRVFDIEGNQINAFYDAAGKLIFVLDNTLNAQKPNVLLVINPMADKKWDEILSNEYDVDLETIRPKVDNKYQKLDIEYSGLPVYENLINAYNAGDDLTNVLNQLAILRDSAARHSAMTRLNVANEIISKTNATIVKTKETIVRLETRIKTLRSNLSAEKKRIGKVNTKQSASKILKLESQLEATNEKLKRAKKRLDSARKRLEIATADAELASGLLNQPSVEVAQKKTPRNKPVMVAPSYPVKKTEPVEEDSDDFDDVDADDDTDADIEEYDEGQDEVIESDVKPLFAEDPQILNDNIAFKPIEFNAPVFKEPKQEYVAPAVPEPEFIPVPTENPVPVVDEPEPAIEPAPVLESFTPIEVPDVSPEPVLEEQEEIVTERPVLETMKPVLQEPDTESIQEQPVADESVTVVEPEVPSEPVIPIAPVVNTFQAPLEVKQEKSRPGFVYYILLLILIALSVFTLWLYQKNMASDTAPVLTAPAPGVAVLEPKPKAAKNVVVPAPDVASESVFLDEAPVEAESAPVVESVAEPSLDAVEEVEYDEEVINVPGVEEAPVVMDAVPGRLNTSGFDSENESALLSEEEILASKPVYEPGAKYDEMFVGETTYTEPEVESAPVMEPEYEFIDDPYYDAEEAAYQAEMANM